MKHKKYLLYQLFALVILFFQCTKNDTSGSYTYSAPYIKSAIEVDGMLGEDAWKNCKKVALKINKTAEVVSDSSFMTWIKTCYDDSTLYFAFICNDPDIWSSFTQRDEHLWEEEAIEIFIDVDDVPETYVEIEVSPANVLFDSYIFEPENIDVRQTARFDLPGIKTAVNVTGTLNVRGDKDENWTVEIAIPFKDLANEKITQVNTKTEIKINFYRLDKNQGMKSMSYAWSPTGAHFHKPAAFGSLIFK